MDTSHLTDWLLDSQIPTIRYLTRTRLLGQPEASAAVKRDRAAIMTDGPVPALLAHQTIAGHWAGEHSYYTPKYTSTHWSMMLMAELHADGSDPRLRQGVEFMLADTEKSIANHLKEGKHGLACLWGNLLRYVALCGLTDDPRARAITEYALGEMQNDHCRCYVNDHHPCAWGTLRVLWGLAAIPESARTPQMQTAIATSLPFLLDDYDLTAANYPTAEGGKVHPMWFKLNFPTFYQADILMTLRILMELDALHRPNAAPALDWLQAKRSKNGRWRGSNPFRSRTWPELGDSEEINRWVSLYAAHILQHAGRLAVA